MKLNETFLITYSPASSRCTSVLEINQVKTSLVQDTNLEKVSTIELIKLRDNVVEWYDEHTKDRNSPDFDNLWNGMMSVTAVIDNIIYTRNFTSIV